MSLPAAKRAFLSRADLYRAEAAACSISRPLIFLPAAAKFAADKSSG